MEQDYPRLQKALAVAGVASRRTCEEMILAGRVTVNGRIVKELGVKVDPLKDVVLVDKEKIALSEPVKPIYVALHKPVGYVSTVEDPHAEKTVLDLVDQIDARIYPVGRLDTESSGLMILTNDGEFALRMTHPRYHVPKVYRVSARGFVAREEAMKLMAGIDLPDGKTLPADLKFIGYTKATQCTLIEMTIYEGRNRQVRRMFEAVGHPVRSLTRVKFGCLNLADLASGTWRKLRKEEIENLLAMAQPTPTPKKDMRRVRETGPYRPRNAAPAPAPTPTVEAEETQPEA